MESWKEIAEYSCFIFLWSNVGDFSVLHIANPVTAAMAVSEETFFFHLMIGGIGNPAIAGGAKEGVWSAFLGCTGILLTTFHGTIVFIREQPCSGGDGAGYRALLDGHNISDHLLG